MPMDTPADTDQIRRELNLKNLKRHDDSIQEIIDSTSYATVYYNTGGDWAKTNIEGPMFIFRRSIEPHYGFFVLNRNGLEYTHELLTPNSEVRMEGQFILYEPHALANRATGIWISAESERTPLCAKMEQLRLHSIAPVPVSKPAPASTSGPLQLPYNQSISLDALFASAPPPPSNAPAKAPTSTPAGSSAKPTGMALLDSIFKSVAPPQVPAGQPTGPPPPSKPKDARDLLASMLGHQLPPPPVPAPAPTRAQLAPNTSSAPLSKPPVGPLPPAPVSSAPKSQPSAKLTLADLVPAASVAPAPAPAVRVPEVARQPQREQPPPKVSPNWNQTQKPSNGPGTTTAPATTLPLFAPPILSHDIFDQLPPIVPITSTTTTKRAQSERKEMDQPKEKEREKVVANGVAEGNENGAQKGGESESRERAAPGAGSAPTSVIGGERKTAKASTTTTKSVDRKDKEREREKELAEKERERDIKEKEKEKSKPKVVKILKREVDQPPFTTSATSSPSLSQATPMTSSRSTTIPSAPLHPHPSEPSPPATKKNGPTASESSIPPPVLPASISQSTTNSLPPSEPVSVPVSKVNSKANSSSVALSKEDALFILDKSLAKSKVGMEPTTGQGEDEGELEPLDKSEFVKKVLELLSKSSFTTSLYSNYVTRFSEEMERREGN